MAVYSAATDRLESRTPSHSPASTLESQPSVEEKDAVEEYSSKLSPSAQIQLSQLGPEENPTVTVLIRLENKLNPTQKQLLQETGAALYTVAGDIISLSIPARSLPDMAALPFVVYIDLSAPLYPEDDENE